MDYLFYLLQYTQSAFIQRSVALTLLYIFALLLSVFFFLFFLNFILWI